MSSPTTTNPTASAVGAIENSAIQALVPIAETAAIAAVPWLGLPIIKQLWEALAGYFADLFSKAIQTGSTFVIIDLQVSQEEGGISTALANLIAAEKTGNAQAIQTAIAAYQAAQSALTHDDGSAVPSA